MNMRRILTFSIVFFHFGLIFGFDKDQKRALRTKAKNYKVERGHLLIKKKGKDGSKSLGPMHLLLEGN